MTVAIETVDLCKQYGRRLAVDRVSLQVESGEVFGFLGANGAGKTTFVKMLLGLVHPTSGVAHLLGRPIQDPRSRLPVGYQPEQFRLPEWMTGTETLELYGQLSGASRQDLRVEIPRALERVGLGGRGNEGVRAYSKGMQQRLALAQALIARPKLVLLDEPTSALDPVGRRDIRDLIRALRDERVTVFLNSHLLAEVELVCDRVAILHEGSVVREGRLQDLLKTSTQLRVVVDAVTPAVVEAVRPFAHAVVPNGRSLDIELLSPDHVPAVTRALHDAGAQIWEVRPQQMSLEDVFIGIVRPRENG
ncbi:MAG: ATP-binding cassette domain-containing protein [Chloroflexi bacterium]|nr:ATP-binding cassette domain-containing protein [Chloroflexota bacterium]